MCTVNAMRALGVKIEQPEPTTLIVYGNKRQLTAPAQDIDCGNSGTSMRLLAGLLAAQPFTSRLIGDASLSRRPMRRIIEPLASMGATVTAEGPKDCPPLVVHGAPLKPIDYASPVASAQVKSAILIAALFTKGKTSVSEPNQSRDHTERMLSYFLVHPKKENLKVSLHGDVIPESRDFTVPGDISSAAFWLVAAAAQQGSHLLVKNVGLNPSRTGILPVLIRMGAQVREIVEVEEAEPWGTIEIKGAPLKATVISGKEIANVIDEIPILAVAAALAEGTTVISDAKELRVKETDRIAAIATNLRAMGVQVTEKEDGMEIVGGSALEGARLESFGDHRIAMAFAVAGLFAKGETLIDGVECVATSYPSFHDTLEAITEAAQQPQTKVISSLQHQ